RQELDKPPSPLNPKSLTDAEGKLVALPPAPADDKGKQEQLKRGRQLFSERGCLACHSHNGTTSAGLDLPAVASEADFAPDLSRLDARVAREEEETNPEAKGLWLVQWTLDPKIPHPRPRMPQTHLTADQAADVAACLLSQDVRDWTQADVSEPESNRLAELAR